MDDDRAEWNRGHDKLAQVLFLLPFPLFLVSNIHTMFMSSHLLTIHTGASLTACSSQQNFRRKFIYLFKHRRAKAIAG